jgi:hypothetical protein
MRSSTTARATGLGEVSAMLGDAAERAYGGHSQDP